MSIGTSLFLIALGAIFAFAVNRTELAGVEIDTVGLILMLVGILGLVITLIFFAPWRERPVADRTVVRDRNVPPPY